MGTKNIQGNLNVTGSVTISSTATASSVVMNSRNLETEWLPENILHSLGAFDTYTFSDGVYTITRQTGYLKYTPDMFGTSTNNAGLRVTYCNAPDLIARDASNYRANVSTTAAGWYSSVEGLESRSSNESFRLYTLSTRTDPIYIQYKVAKTVVEKVEAKHYAASKQAYVNDLVVDEANKTINLLSTFSAVTGSVAARSPLCYVNFTFKAGKTYRISFFADTFNNGGAYFNESYFDSTTVDTSEGGLYFLDGQNGSIRSNKSGKWFVSRYIKMLKDVSIPDSKPFIKNAGTELTYNITDLMITEGETVYHSYQPYNGPITHYKDLAVAQYNLGAFDSFRDNQDGSVTITRQTGYLLLDGNAPIASAKWDTNLFYITVPNLDVITESSTTVVSNKIKATVNITNEQALDNGSAYGIAQSGYSRKLIFIRPNSSFTSSTTLDTLRQYLDNNPINIEYKLSSATVETILKEGYNPNLPIPSNWDSKSLYKLGAYDSIVDNGDGTVKITRRTGYIDIARFDYDCDTCTSLGSGYYRFWRPMPSTGKYAPFNLNSTGWGECVVSGAFSTYPQNVGGVTNSFGVDVVNHVFLIKSNECTTSLEFNTKFVSNPMHIEYKLATPTFETVVKNTSTTPVCKPSIYDQRALYKLGAYDIVDEGSDYIKIMRRTGYVNFSDQVIKNKTQWMFRFTNGTRGEFGMDPVPTWLTPTSVCVLLPGLSASGPDNIKLLNENWDIIGTAGEVWSGSQGLFIAADGCGFWMHLTSLETSTSDTNVNLNNYLTYFEQHPVYIQYKLATPFITVDTIKKSKDTNQVLDLMPNVQDNFTYNKVISEVTSGLNLWRFEPGEKTQSGSGMSMYTKGNCAVVTLSGTNETAESWYELCGNGWVDRTRLYRLLQKYRTLVISAGTNGTYDNTDWRFIFRNNSWSVNKALYLQGNWDSSRANRVILNNTDFSSPGDIFIHVYLPTAGKTCNFRSLITMVPYDTGRNPSFVDYEKGESLRETDTSLLWSNASPGSVFAAQQITISNTAPYQYIKVVWRRLNSIGTVLTNTFNNAVGGVGSLYDPESNTFRKITIDSATKITFTAPYTAGTSTTVSTDFIIPVAIYGCRYL